MTSLAEFVDSHTRPPGGGPDSRYVQVEASPASQRIMEGYGDPQFIRQTLATLFWWCYVRTPQFLLSWPDTPPEPRQEIVVSHADGTLHDLLVLVPGAQELYTVVVAPTQGRGVAFGAPRGRRGESPLSRQIFAVAQAQTGAISDMLKNAGLNVSPRAIGPALAELALFGTFQVIVAAEPELIPTEFSAGKERILSSLAAPAPALAVAVSSDMRLVATAGVIAEAATLRGTTLAITARHAVDMATSRGEKILVGCAPVQVAGSHELTDTCLLVVTCHTARGAGLASVLRFAPAEHRPATFNGAASGPKQTRIRGYDLSVLESQLHLSSKVYTDPDTNPGDSGAALIDSEDQIVGFAVSRTALGAQFEFSTWSWAEQVLSAYGLWA